MMCIIYVNYGNKNKNMACYNAIVLISLWHKFAKTHQKPHIGQIVNVIAMVNVTQTMRHYMATL